jgi:hypothetical protein
MLHLVWHQSFSQHYNAIGMPSASTIAKTAAVYHRTTRKGRRYLMRSPLQSLEAKIAQIKQEITGLGADLQPGRLTQQYNVCGKAGCRCKANPPQRHGPYYQLSFTRKGKSRTQFVKREDLLLLQQQVRNYQRLKTLMDRWVALGMALSQLRLRQQQELRMVSAPKQRAQARVSRQTPA